jgi:hypothetical protein
MWRRRRLSAPFLALSVALLAGTTALVQAAAPQTDSQKIAVIESVTQQIRGLAPTHGVKVSILSDAAFDKAIRSQIRRDTPDAEIAINQREQRLLGLLARSNDLRRITYGASVSNVMGLYDYVTRTLYVRNHQNLAFGPERYVLAHEYTHALQDQHFHLAALIPDQFPIAYRNSDQVEAHRSLAEGDAVTTQLLFIQRTYSRSQLDQVIKIESAQPAPAMPKALLRANNFPYTVGLNFVKRLYRLGGMTRVDAAYAKPPSSTYEIMHPSAYLSGWKPTVVSLHGVQGFADWQQLDDDVLGAFGYDLTLWQFLGKKTADALTAGYRGDRYIFLTKATQAMLLFKSVWGSPAAAQAIKQAWLASLSVRFRKGTAHPISGTTVFHDKAMSVYLRVIGPQLTLAYGRDPVLVQQLGAAVTT